MAAPLDALTVHRPERGRKGRPVTLCQAGSTSSCCCCCLHTLGGIVLSATHSFAAPPETDSGPEPSIQPPLPPQDDTWWSVAATSPARPRNPRPSGQSVGPVYWKVFGIMAAICLVTGPVGWAIGGIFGPAVQLAASLITFLVIVGNDGLESPRLRSLGRITLWGVLGCIAGIVLMYLLYLVMLQR